MEFLVLEEEKVVVLTDCQCDGNFTCNGLYIVINFPGK